MVGRIWRVSKTPITLLALLLLLLLAARWGYNAVTAPLPPPYVEPCVQQPAPGKQMQSSQVSVRVLNGSKSRGKAGDVAQQLKAKGFKVVRTGNTDDPVAKTTVIGFSADAPEVKLVAAFFKEAEIVGDGRVDHSVEVHIGEKYDGMNPDAPVSIDVSSDSVCLPKPPTAAPV